MKILYLSSSSDWHIDLWVKYFTEKHDVFLFSDKEDYLNNQPFESVTIVYSSGIFGWLLNLLKISSHKLFQLNKLISTRFFASKIDQIIRCEDIDMIHAHSLYYGYLASYIKSNIPVIFTPMGSDIIIHANKNLVYKYMAKKAFEKADVVTGDSKLIQRQGYNLGASKNNNFIIQNGVDSSIFFPQTNDIRSEFKLSEDELLIFSPRAIDPLYNIDTIIDSLSELKNQGIKFKCMFSFPYGGENFFSLRSKVINLELKEFVIWLGYIEYSDMQLYYNASDIIISVPTSDSSPKSVYEAMFCSKPIIISDLEWSHEMLDELDCVIRVKAKDSSELTKAIYRIINDDNLRQELSKNANILAKQYFDYEVNMSKMEDIMLGINYSQLL